MQNLDEIFIDFSVDKLKQLGSRIENCLSKLSDEQVWERGAESENAAGNLVLHLCGNLRQWIGFGVGGQPDVRQRDSEFAARGQVSRDELAQKLSAAVEDTLEILRGVSAQRLGEIILVQNYRVTVLEAIYHVVEHFAQHTGQIIFATKLLTGSDLGYYQHLSAKVPATAGPDSTP